MNPAPSEPGLSVDAANPWRSPGRTLVEVLKYRAHRHGDDILFGFLDADLKMVQSLSYSSLLERATRYAEELLARGLTGRCALLAFPQGADFIVAYFAAIMARVIPVPVKTPRREEEFARFSRMARDSGAAAILMCADQLPIFERIATRVRLEDLPTLFEPTSGESAGKLLPPMQASPDDVALLQYTSGSTSDPKGIQVTHANLLSNLDCIRTGFENRADTISLSWLPMFHDMGLIGHVLEPLYVGFPAYFLNPALVIQEPARWLRAISRYRVTATGGPNFGYELCLRRPPSGEEGGLDLSSWKVAYTGSEPIVASTIEEFSSKFAALNFSPHAFYPCYGLAEATLIVTGGRADDEVVVLPVDGEQLARGRAVPGANGAACRRLVASGPPRPGVSISIVEPGTASPLGDREIGEIWVAGPIVAAGYWGKPEATRRTFDARLPDQPETAFLRTGDLGFLDNGQLFVVGRLQDMIIIRGRNLYPEDIEAAVTSVCADWGLTGCAVFADEDPKSGATSGIVVALEFLLHSGELDQNEISSHVRAIAASAFGVTADAVVFVSRLPRTTSGKVRRSECARRYQVGDLGSGSLASD